VAHHILNIRYSSIPCQLRQYTCITNHPTDTSVLYYLVLAHHGCAGPTELAAHLCVHQTADCPMLLRHIMCLME
jgi:hypothetical protein